MENTATIKTNRSSTISIITICYILALSLIGLLSIGGYIMLKSVIENEKSSSTVVNISGRQRRLSINVAFDALNLTTLKNETAAIEDNRTKLKEAIALMERSHIALSSGSGDLGLPKTLSTEMKRIYFDAPQNLDRDVREYLRRAKNVAYAPSEQLTVKNPDVQYVTKVGTGLLVDKLDKTVQQYQSEAQQKIQQIQQLELSFLLTTLLLLFAEAVLIFLPMSKTIRAQIQELLDSQQELNAVFDTVGDALITLDSDQRVTTANMQSQKILGGSRHELMGKTLDSLIKNSQEHVSLTGANMLGKFMESETLQENGQKVPLEVVVTKTNLSDRVLYTVSLRDITERKNAEKKVSDFYSTVAHELRSPLTSIKGSLQILQGGLAGEMSPKATRLIDIGAKETERLTRLIDDFLDLKKIANGNFELKKSNYSLFEIASTSTAGLSSMAASAGVTLEVKGTADVRVECDRDRIIQVFTNLISNAIKFAVRDSVVTIKIEHAVDRHRVRSSIKNIGPEISIADMPKMFGMFQQLDSAKIESKKGTGLGLAISKALVEQHGGNIGVESNPGEGTTFWFEI